MHSPHILLLILPLYSHHLVGFCRQYPAQLLWMTVACWRRKSITSFFFSFYWRQDRSAPLKNLSSGLCCSFHYILSFLLELSYHASAFLVQCSPHSIVLFCLIHCWALFLQYVRCLLCFKFYFKLKLTFNIFKFLI